MAAISDIHKQMLISKKPQLIGSLRDLNGIIVLLEAAFILTDAEIENIKAEKTDRDRIDKLITYLCKGSEAGFFKFREALEEQKQGYLAELLMPAEEQGQSGQVETPQKVEGKGTTFGIQRVSISSGATNAVVKTSKTEMTKAQKRALKSMKKDLSYFNQAKTEALLDELDADTSGHPILTERERNYILAEKTTDKQMSKLVDTIGSAPLSHGYHALLEALRNEDVGLDIVADKIEEAERKFQ